MSKWRDHFKVHPAADVFPIMSDEEIDRLAEHIKANGLTSPISFFVSERLVGSVSIEYVKANGILADGRNRLEAMERAGIELTPCAMETVCIREIEPVAFIIGRNIQRRHLTKQEQADLIVAAHNAERKGTKVADVSRQHGGKLSRRGRAEGRKVDEIKSRAVAVGKECGIGKRTIERSFAKVEGKESRPTRSRKPRLEPEFKPESVMVEDHLEPLTHNPKDPYQRLLKAFHRAPHEARDRLIKAHVTRVVSIETARRNYLLVAEQCVDDLDTEQRGIIDTFREFAAKRLLDAGTCTHEPTAKR